MPPLPLPRPVAVPPAPRPMKLPSITLPLLAIRMPRQGKLLIARAANGGAAPLQAQPRLEVPAVETSGSGERYAGTRSSLDAAGRLRVVPSITTGSSTIAGSGVAGEIVGTPEPAIAKAMDSTGQGVRGSDRFAQGAVGDIADAVPGIRRRVDGEGHVRDEVDVDDRRRRAALQHDEVRSGPGTEAQRQQSDQGLGPGAGEAMAVAIGRRRDALDDERGEVEASAGVPRVPAVDHHPLGSRGDRHGAEGGGSEATHGDARGRRRQDQALGRHGERPVG